MPTQIHGTVSTWAAKLIVEGRAVGAWGPGGIELVSEGRLQRLATEYHGM